MQAPRQPLLAYDFIPCAENGTWHLLAVQLVLVKWLHSLQDPISPEPSDPSSDYFEPWAPPGPPHLRRARSPCSSPTVLSSPHPFPRGPFKKTPGRRGKAGSKARDADPEGRGGAGGGACVLRACAFWRRRRRRSRGRRRRRRAEPEPEPRPRGGRRRRRRWRRRRTGGVSEGRGAGAGPGGSGGRGSAPPGLRRLVSPVSPRLPLPPPRSLGVRGGGPGARPAGGARARGGPAAAARAGVNHARGPSGSPVAGPAGDGREGPGPGVGEKEDIVSPTLQLPEVSWPKPISLAISPDTVPSSLATQEM